MPDGLFFDMVISLVSGKAWIENVKFFLLKILRNDLLKVTENNIVTGVDRSHVSCQ